MSGRELIVGPEARSELRRARDWYQVRSRAIAQRFRRVVLETFEEIAESPEAWPTVHGGIRRALTRGFPYAVFYAVEPKSVVILSVLHQARSPRRWPNGA